MVLNNSSTQYLSKSEERDRNARDNDDRLNIIFDTVKLLQGMAESGETTLVTSLQRSISLPVESTQQ